MGKRNGEWMKLKLVIPCRNSQFFSLNVIICQSIPLGGHGGSVETHSSLR